MDIDVQNAQISQRRLHERDNPGRPRLPERDNQGRPRSFHCNIYGHVRKHCRKLKQQQSQKNYTHTHTQNVQVTLADAASLAELPGNL